MSTRLYTHPIYLEHLTPAGHPERPDRMWALEKAFSDERFNSLDRQEPDAAGEEAVLLVHPETHLTYIKSMIPEDGMMPIDADTLASPRSFEAAMTAIGGAVARKGAPTLAIAGDYGFQYTVQELGTAVELGLSLPILLWDNHKLKEIEDSMVRAQIAPNSVIAQNPDFAALARAYGAYAKRPDSPKAVAQAVQSAFSADRPTLIHVAADISL